MIYPVDSRAARLAAARVIRDQLIALGTDGDPIELIIVDHHIRDFDVIYCQRECSRLLSVKLANSTMRMSMYDRASLVLGPDATPEQISTLLVSEGVRIWEEANK